MRHTIITNTILSIIFILMAACEKMPNEKPINYVPEWTHEAVWYQIFTERFRDGDPSNNPRLIDIQGSYPFDFPDSWAITPWQQDWYKMEPWAIESEMGFYKTVQMRRFGGDLQGVIDKLDYLSELGINAIYFNPLNDSPSMHKYDARNYHHIDINFGPDPEGDLAIIARENPLDPDTWEWTSADLLFLELIKQAKARGIRVVMDYSWNHTGSTFWAWKDVLENQQDSPYAHWYEIESFNNPETEENEFHYVGWAGVETLPEFKKIDLEGEREHGLPFEGNLDPEVVKHIFDVTRRWMDPDGDGDPSDGIDGFRLDVAEQVPLGFWRDYRKFVRSINPEATLIGEVWWQYWPEVMADPIPYLNDVFDSVMHYRWYMPTRSFLANTLPEVSATEYVAHLDSVMNHIPDENMKAMMNLTSSHDAPRFATSVFNKGRYKYQVNPRENPEYKLHKPDDLTWQQQKLILINQFTFIGAPHIWMGDEMGMWGADDPDNRKPLMWDDIDFENEQYHPMKGKTVNNRVRFNDEVFSFHQHMIAMRKQYPALIHGSIEWLYADDASSSLAYKRELDDTEIIVLFNASDQPQELTVKTGYFTYFNILNCNESYSADSELTVTLPPIEALILSNICNDL